MSGFGCGSGCGSSSAPIDLCSSSDEADAVSDDAGDHAADAVLDDGVDQSSSSGGVDYGWYDDDIEDDSIPNWLYDTESSDDEPPH